MTGTDVAVIQSQGSLALRGNQVDWTDQQRAALAQIGVAEASAGDQLVFLHVSQRMGLDPFNREIYMIGRWDSELGRKRWTIQVGIDGFRSKSEEHEQFGGVGDEEWCGPDGEWHDVWVSSEPPVAARFSVYRKDQTQPVRGTAHYQEYVQTKKDGKPTVMWATRPAGQLIKCAEALARRRAFPRTLGGVYAPEELQHLDNPQSQPTVVIAERVESPAEPDWDTLIAEGEAAGDPSKLWDLRKLAQGIRPNDGVLLNRIAEAWQRAKAAASAPTATQPAEKAQKDHLFGLLRDGAVSGKDRAVRLRIVTRILNRPPAEPVTSFDDLTAAEVTTINDFLQRRKDAGDLTHTLADLGAAAAAPVDEPPAPPEPEGTKP